MNRRQFSNMSEILAEKARLTRKIKKQEKVLMRDWERIEHGWRFLGKISRLFSSSLLMKGIDFFSRLFFKK